MAGYKNLDIYNIAYDFSLQIHRMTLALPRLEMYEEASQIRRSSKSTCANSVEGFALRKYKNEYIHFLYRAYGSCEETIFHLEELFDTGSLSNKELHDNFIIAYHNLSAKLFKFIQVVERNYQLPNYLKEPELSYSIDPPV